MDHTLMQIYLRNVEPADSELIRGMRNRPKIRHFMFHDREIGQEEHERWFHAMLSDPAWKYWIIHCDGYDVGTISLYGIDRGNKRAYWGFYVVDGPEVRGKHVGHAAILQMLDYAFYELGLEKVCCECLDFNRAVIRLNETVGFQQEGRLRRHIWRDDGPHDVIPMAIFREYWLSRGRPQPWNPDYQWGELPHPGKSNA